jgi:hypothetical protein
LRPDRGALELRIVVGSYPSFWGVVFFILSLGCQQSSLFCTYNLNVSFSLTIPSSGGQRGILHSLIPGSSDIPRSFSKVC